MIQKNETEGSAGPAVVPYVRRGAPPELWPRIELSARRIAARRRARTLVTRLAACAAGFALWLGVASVVDAGADARTSDVHPDASARAAARAELPPEARLVALLFEREGSGQ